MSKIIIDSNGRPYMDQNGRVLTVDASIDSNIQAGNIKNGVTIMGVVGNYAPALQSKSVSPSTSQQTVSPDSGYAGLSGVTVSAVTSAIDSNIKAANIKSGVSILGVNGSYAPLVEERSVTPTTSQQILTPSSGKDGMSKVTVAAVTSSIDSNIQQGNIKKGVAILGVTGNYEGEGGGDVIQTNLAIKTIAKTSLSATGLSITVAQSGTYRISWAAFRSYSSGTFSTRVYVGGSAKGTDHTTWTNSYGQQVTETGIALTAGQVVEVYARSSSTSRYTGVMNLVIEKTA